MILKAGEREIELIFKSKKIELFGDKYSKGDTSDYLQMAAYDGSHKVVRQILTMFSDEFKNDDAAYDFIDELIENGKKIVDIYTEIFEGLNERGVFTEPLTVSLEAPPMSGKKMMKELTQSMSSQRGIMEMVQLRQKSLDTGETLFDNGEQQPMNAG